jgi:hypothetical protein
MCQAKRPGARRPFLVAYLDPLLRNKFAEILGRDVGKIRVPEDFNDLVEWTDEERAGARSMRPGALWSL